MKKLFSAACLCLTLTACGSDTNSSHTPAPNPEVSFIPAIKSVSEITIVDVSGQPVPNADVVITNITPEQVVTKSISVSAMGDGTKAGDVIITVTDSEGLLNLDGLVAGLYRIKVILNGKEYILELEVSVDTASEVAVIIASISLSTDADGIVTVTDMDEKGLFTAISGVVYDKNGPLADAQVEISAGESTNGAISTAVTNENGEYSLIVNVALKKTVAMKSASMRAYKVGYMVSTLNGLDFSEGGSITGFNFKLVAEEQATTTIYSESFDYVGDGVCNNWQTETLSAYRFGENSVSEPVVEASKSLWHQHEVGLNIQNQAYVQQLVVLAPDDTSEAYIPDPVAGGACWYGQADAGGVTQGNFLGEVDTTTDKSDMLNGGISTLAHAAALITPVIDLTHHTAPLALNFRTWWEIESVNPNENGFDIMGIEYSLDEAQSWLPLARLNPLSDPADEVNRDPIPYSNRGYNKAPEWLWVEPMSLNELAGYKVQLRFVFNTDDHFYNGFRGWLIDDVSITNTEGTFPVFKAPVFEISSVLVDDLVSEGANTEMEINASIEMLVATEGRVELVLIDAIGAETILLSQPLTAEDVNMDLSASFDTFRTSWNYISVHLYDASGELLQEKSVYSVSEQGPAAQEPAAQEP